MHDDPDQSHSTSTDDNATVSRGRTLDYNTGRNLAPKKHPRPPAVSILAISLILLPLTILATYPIALRLPYGWDALAHVEIRTPHTGRWGQSSFFVNGCGAGRYNREQFSSANVTYTGDETPGDMQVDLKTMTYRLGLYGYEHLGARPLTQDAVLDYISRGGFDPKTSEAQAIATAILRELKQLSANQLPPDRTTPSNALPISRVYYRMRGENVVNLGGFGSLVWLPWYTVFCVPVWLLASIWIGRKILRRYRRKLEDSLNV